MMITHKPSKKPSKITFVFLIKLFSSSNPRYHTEFFKTPSDFFSNKPTAIHSYYPTSFFTPSDFLNPP